MHHVFYEFIYSVITQESFISRECVTMCHLGIRDNKGYTLIMVILIVININIGSSLIAIGSEDCTVTILAIEGTCSNYIYM